MARTTRILAFLFLGGALAACDSSDIPDARIHLSPPDAMEDEPDAATKPDAALTADAKPDSPLPADAMPPTDAAVDAPPDAPPDAAPPMGPATMVLNELSPNFAENRDLVELLVTGSGHAKDWQLEDGYPHAPTVLAKLPDAIVYEGQVIVLHLDPAGTTAMEETESPDQFTSADNFDTAWDFLGNSNQLPYINDVLALRDPNGNVASAVPFFRADVTDPDQRPRTFPDDLQGIIDEGLWADACTPEPCTYESDLASVTVSWLFVDPIVDGVSADPDSVAGASLARRIDATMNTAADWAAIPTEAPFNTYGLPNDAGKTRLPSH